MRIFILAAVVAMFGCKGGEKGMSFTGQEWELKSMTKNDSVVANPQQLPTLVFSDTNSAVYGSAGCNRFFGTYATDQKGGLTIKTGGATMMYCPDMNFEDAYVKALNGIASYSVKNNELTLTDSAKGMILIYQPVDTTKHLVGGTTDVHGCNGTAGYTWSEVRQNCIRLFEDGLRMNSVADTAATSSAFVVFAVDSTKAEVFLPGSETHPILDRRDLPAGGYAWNQEDDDTFNVRMADGEWVMEQRGNILYKQAK